MPNIRISNELHKYLMDHKNADHNSAEKVILGMISQADGMNKLKLFVWEGFNPDYTDGLAFAIAETKEEAKTIISRGGYCEWGDLTIIDPIKECGYRISGGG